MPEGQFGGHDAFGEQALRTVEIGQQRFEQACPLCTPASIARHSSAAISRGNGSSCQGRSRPCGSA